MSANNILNLHPTIKVNSITGINVLSLFDGMSCGRVALERAGIEVNSYYSSEIDKYAIQVANKNYPKDEDKRLGDVTKWQGWNIDWSSIDLVTGGFPCQAWSVAGKQQGDKDERGMLFWTMLDIMKKVLEHNPKANFLIENVKMKKEFEEYITFHTTQALGRLDKHLINSSLISAQSRERYYWTNIPFNRCIEDKSISLVNIIDYTDNSNISIHSNTRLLNTYNKFIDTLKGVVWIDSYNKLVKTDKSSTLTTRTSASCLTHIFINGNIRKPNPIECERLQTLPDNYTEGVSNSQRFKMIGNGWTVDVIAHLLKGIK